MANKLEWPRVKCQEHCNSACLSHL